MLALCRILEHVNYVLVLCRALEHINYVLVLCRALEHINYVLVFRLLGYTLGGVYPRAHIMCSAL